MNRILKDFVGPTAVLTVICLVVSTALSYTFGITNPIIEENKRAAANAAMAAVLPEADSFTQVEGQLPEGVAELYTAQNGAGYVAKVAPAGYGGPISMMVGVSADQTIAGVKVLESSETQGLGSKAMDASYTEQFTGKTGAEEVDSISGATISSKGLKSGITAALSAAGAAGKGGND